MLLVFLCAFLGNSVSTHINDEQEEWKSGISQTYYQLNTALCPSGSQCVPLSSCSVLANVLNHECVNTQKVGSLGCNYPNSGYICCPLNAMYQNSWYMSQYPMQYPNVPGSNINSGIENSKCGRSVVQGINYSGIGSHPWVVRIGFRNSVTGEIKYPCAGSILNKRIILTAAHCGLAKADNYKLFSVRVGEWRTDSTLDCGDEFCARPIQDISINHVIVHPGYEQATFKDDIALLVLNTDINYTVTAQPICILNAWSQPSNQAVLVGWGRSAGQQVKSPIQQVIDLPVINIQQCINVYSRTIPVSEDQLCAGGQYGKDACEGFGGAPLIVKHSGVYYQTGILSFGSNQCGAAGIPSVYVNIKKYSEWIKQNIPVMYSN